MSVQPSEREEQESVQVRHPAGELAALPSTSIGQVTKAIASVMLEIDKVAKRGQNTFHDYRYARMEDILQRLTPLLGKHGLAIFQDEVGRSMLDNDSVIAITYEFVVAHESGEVWPQRLRQTGASRCRDTKGGWDDKAVNKCHTAARKYFLLSLFQVPTGDETDPDQDGTAGPVRRHPNKSAADVKAWVTKVLAGIRQLTTIRALDQFLEDRRPQLERLAIVSPDQRRVVDAAIERRRSELTSPTRALPPLVAQRNSCE
jgi:hypothetical protein